MLEIAYQIKTERFEGPLDLLLSFIEKRKLFINDISLAEVTDDFISYIENRKDFPFQEIAQFILVASTLLLIKSKSLLPLLTLTEEEEGDIEDLENRLKEYQKFKDLSTYIKERFGKNIIFPRNTRIIEPFFSPTEEITIENLLKSVRNVTASFPEEKKVTKTTVKKVVSLEEVIENLMKRISEGIKMSFREFSGNARSGRENIIVSFLAVLELVKRGIVEAEQQNHFSDIEINKNINYPDFY